MSSIIQPIAALFVRADSVYKAMPDVDAWDAERDARKWAGGSPLVAHPPCRSWGRMRQFAQPREDEKDLARFAVAMVRKYGGVLEHPAESTLWADQFLPRPGRAPDAFGGWSFAVDQFHFGHRAEKSTWLYVVGVHPDDIPPIPFREGRPTHCVRPTKSYPRLPSITKAEREHSPAEFAKFLVELARRCSHDHQKPKMVKEVA
jgi:hypothetical protein